MLPDRMIKVFCPFADFAQRFPDWTYHCVDLHGLDELIDFGRKSLLIDPKDDGEEWALTHAMVHLDYDGDDGVGAFTAVQEQTANDLAEVRLMGSRSDVGAARSFTWLERAMSDRPPAAYVEDDDVDLADVPFDGEPTVRL